MKSFYWLIKNSFNTFLSDEYQDTNGIQNAILFQLASFWDQPNLFAVGDDDQSIYRFQGANVENIEHFIESFLSPYGEAYEKERIVQLQRNYRSSQRILNEADVLIRNNLHDLLNRAIPIHYMPPLM